MASNELNEIFKEGEGPSMSGDRFAVSIDPNHATAKATAARVANQALRAIDDPVRLQRAVRIVRAALARKRITVAELVDMPIVPEPPAPDRSRHPSPARSHGASSPTSSTGRAGARRHDGSDQPAMVADLA